MGKEKQVDGLEHRRCINCVHMYACQLWNTGSMRNTIADWCSVYETTKETNAYYIGLCDGRKEK